MTSTSVFHDILSAVSSALDTPVAVILVLLLAFAVFSIGWILTEFFTEHRHLKECLPQLLDELRAEPENRAERISHSTLLARQKEALLELTRHPAFTDTMRGSLAENLLAREQAFYDLRLKRTDLAAKLAPMFGLLGTLIPLGPGIIALGGGDTYTLSVSLRTAFDTTIAGLVVAAVCLVISTVRRRWYRAYMADLETLTDCVLELEAGK